MGSVLMLRRLLLTFLLLGGLVAGPAWAQVAHDADGTVCNKFASTTPETCTPITVGSGTNRGLVVYAIINGTVTSVTANWDSTGTNQSMTLIGHQLNVSGDTGVWVFCLAAPTAGLKTLSVAHVGGSPGQQSFNAVSFTGVNQTTPCKNFTSGNDGGVASNPATVTITSATGDMTTAAYSNDNQNFTTVSATEIDSWVDNQASFGTAGNYHAGAASNTMTGTLSGTGDWIAAGVDVASATVACKPTRTMVGVGC